jgi:hypothetical protein
MSRSTIHCTVSGMGAELPMPCLLLRPQYARACSGVSSPVYSSSTGARRMTGLCTTPFLLASLKKASRVSSGDSLMLFTSVALPARVSTAASLSPWPCIVGVAQGCPLSPFLHAGLIDGLLASVHSECADAGLLAGASPLVLQAYADDKSRSLQASRAFNASCTL